MKNGVPFDTAFRLSDVTRTAFAIVFSEFESGREFDWSAGLEAGQFKKRRE